MNLLEAIEKVGQPQSKQDCKVGTWIKSQEPSDRDALIKYVQQLREGTADVSINWLYKVTRAMGATYASGRLYIHVQGECRCPK